MMGNTSDYIQSFIASWWKRIIFFLLLVIISSVIFNLIYKVEEDNPLKWLAPILLASLIIESLRRGGAWYSFGIRFDRYLFKDIGLGFCFAFFSIFLIIIVATILGADFNLSNNKFDSKIFFSISSLLFATAVIEELLFRGLIFQSLIERFSSGLIIIIFSLLFSLGHYLNPNINILAYINIFIAGILLSLMYIKTLSLWLPISFHFFWNWMQDAFLSTSISGVEFGIHLSRLNTESINHDLSFIIGGRFGIEQGLLTTFILFAIIFAVNKFITPSPYMASRLFKRKYLESILLSK